MNLSSNFSAALCLLIFLGLFFDLGIETDRPGGIHAVRTGCGNTVPNIASAAERTGGYAGLEFLGSSLISRLELDKLLHLKQGASYESIVKSAEKLKLELEAKSVKAMVEIVPDGADFYVSVDVLDTGFNNTVQNRRLENPRHIGVPNEKPFVLLAELKDRMQKLVDEERPTSESYDDGMRSFSDLACQRIAEKIAQELPGMRPYILRILLSEPNGERRAQAAELMNWIPDPVGNSAELIPALDDSDMRVRMVAAKYLWARIGKLPDSFPFDLTLEGLSRQLTRQTYHDRVRAMSALLALAKRNSDLITGIKSFDEAKLQDIASTSTIPDVQKRANQLLKLCSNPPALKKVEPDSSAY